MTLLLQVRRAVAVLSCAATFHACGGAEVATPTVIRTRFPISKANCPTSALADLKARVFIRNLDGVDVREPCPLQLTVVGDNLELRGTCKGVTGREDKNLLLQWYVTSTFTQADVIVAESELTIALSRATVADVRVEIDPADISIRSKPAANEAVADRDRFNCDRTSINYCVTSGTASGPDNDTCSNLEELCAGTLFTTDVKQCP